MIQITDHNTGKTTKYATKGAEFIDSIFTPDQGIARRHFDGFICQFKKQDDGKIYFFHTLDKITITE